MIRVDKSGYIKSDPQDVFLDPQKFIIATQDGKVSFHPKWGSLKFLPKRFIAYVDTLLNQYYTNPSDLFDWKIVVYLVLATSRCYSALSRLYRKKKKNFKTLTYLEDLFHEVIVQYLELRKAGKTVDDIFSYTNQSNLLESTIISKYIALLRSIQIERPFGSNAVMDSFVHGQVEDDNLREEGD